MQHACLQQELAVKIDGIAAQLPVTRGNNANVE
jgi:hypothetical protein